ncbi:MAG TPA: 3-methyladenine DNA glycosylase [Bacteroidales bacterium]|nr:3-methyladenine DNA glycosylase [Bacteroidales bacterium]
MNKQEGKRIAPDFFLRDVLVIAPELLGKILVRKFDSGTIERYVISETEAYRGEEDLACHASKGRKPRVEPMYRQGGILYVYLIYGMYHMLNMVTAPEGNPEAVLLRGLTAVNGPGRLTKMLEIDQSFNFENLQTSERIWLEEPEIPLIFEIKTAPRIGIDYAGELWKNKPWRFYIG